MKHRLTHFVFVIILLAALIEPLAAIGFQSEPLKDNSMVNYHVFGGSDNLGIDDSFETLAADLNGDGVEDIVSVGGYFNYCYPVCGVSPPHIPVGVQVMLYEDEQFILKGSNPLTHSLVIIDMNLDGALDLVLSSGYILLNDGSGGFENQIQYNDEEIIPRTFYRDYFGSFVDSQLSPEISQLLNGSYAASQINDYFSVADWDQDGDLDIVSPNHVFINGGDFNFTSITNELAAGNRIYAINLNDDNKMDWLIFRDGSVESWQANNEGSYDLLQQTPSSDVVVRIEDIDLNGDSLDDLVQSYIDADSAEFKVRAMLGNGQGGFQPLSKVSVSLKTSVHSLRRPIFTPRTWTMMVI